MTRTILAALLLLTSALHAEPADCQNLLYQLEHYEARKCIEPEYRAIIQNDLQETPDGRAIVRIYAEAGAYRDDEYQRSLTTLQQLAQHNDTEGARAQLALARLQKEGRDTEAHALKAAARLQPDSADYHEARILALTRILPAVTVTASFPEEGDPAEPLEPQITINVEYPPEVHQTADQLNASLKRIEALEGQSPRYHHALALCRQLEADNREEVARQKAAVRTEIREEIWKRTFNRAAEAAALWRQRHPIETVTISTSESAYAYHRPKCETIAEAHHLRRVTDLAAITEYQREACLVCRPASSRAIPEDLRTFRFDGKTFNLLDYSAEEAQLAQIFQPGKPAAVDAWEAAQGR